MQFSDLLMAAAAGGGRGFIPLDLGAPLLAWWDAERADLITHVAGAVSSWRDVKNGYDLTQPSGGGQPTYSATSFNGRPGITADGTSDSMELITGVSAWIPTGAAVSEDWYVFDQTRDDADAQAVSVLGGWGDTTGNNTSRLTGRILSTVSRAQARTGTGASSSVSTNTSAAFNGRHVVRSIVSATTTTMEIDGVPNTPVAVVPGTAAVNTRVRLFSNLASTPGGLAKGVLSTRLIFGTLLTAPQATQLYTYLNRRL